MPLSSSNLNSSVVENNSSFGGGVDLNSSEGLLQLAQLQGGAIGQVAEELVHPNKGILSSIGDGFKKSFSKFVDLISIPNQVVAGVLSDKYSISEAVKQNISTSDVLFGDQDPNSTTMKKVGSFLVRTATDILLDPLTYVTFGASKGIAGISSLQKVQLGEKAAAELGKDAFTKVALSEGFGEGIYRYLNAQAKGTAKASEIASTLGLKAGSEELKVAIATQKEFLNVLVQNTLDAPLNVDFAKKAITNMLEINPAFAETILDKGGIKVFGKSILSGQRIASSMAMIPGMTLIDNATEPFRLAVGSLFDPTIEKQGQKYVRIPEELVEIRNMAKKVAEARKDKKFGDLNAIVKENKLTKPELDILSPSLLLGKIPADKRLAGAYENIIAGNKETIAWMRESGVNITEKENWGFPLIRQDVENISFNPNSSSLAKKGGATFERSSAKFVDVMTGQEIIGTPETLNLVRKNTAEEITRITANAEKNIESKGMKIESINKEMEKLHSFISEAFQGKATGEFSKLIDGLSGIDKENARQFMNVFKDQMNKLDVERLTQTFAKNTMEEGIKIKEIITSSADKMSPQALERLKGRIASGELQLPGNIEDINVALKEATPNINKARVVSTEADIEDEIAQLAKKLKLQSSAKRFSQIGEDIDKEALFKFVDTIQKQFEANPTGVRKMLNQIIGDKQQVLDLVNEIDLERTIAKQNISDLPETDVFFQTKDGNNIYKKVAATIEEYKTAGLNFIDNPIVAIAIRESENAKVGAGRRMLRDVTSTFGKLKSEAPDGYRAINMSNVGEVSESMLQILGKEGEEFLFPPIVANSIEKAIKGVITDDPTNDLLKSYDKLQNLYKAGVTSVFLQFHGRNGLSNVFQNLMDIGLHAINPANHAMATQMVYYDKKANKLERIIMNSSPEISGRAKDALNEFLGTKIYTDVTGYDWTVGELRQTMKERGIAFRGDTGQIDVFDKSSVDDFTDNLFGVETKVGKVKKIAKTVLPVSQEFAPFKAGRALGSMIEDQAKVLNFMVNLRATGDVSHAAARTNMFLFDYQNLTNFEKTFLKRLIPFYTFTRKNLELQVKTLASTPGRISAELTGLRNLGEAMSGGELTDEEKSNLPKWMQSGIGILKSRKGSTLEMFNSLGTPIEQPFAAFQPNQFLGSVSPLLRVPIETATGYSWFQGKALSDATNAAAYKNAPKVLKDAIGYTELTGKRKDGTEFKWSVALRPEMMNTINNLPLFGRVLSSLKQMEDVDISTQGKILQQLIGVKAYSVNLEDESNKRELEMENKLKALLTKAGVTAQFTRTYIPKTK